MTPTAFADRQAAHAFVAAQLHPAHPHLVPVSERANSLVAAAKNIRIELSRAFPDVRFSVRSDRFSGGDAIRISWVDGPTTAQVDAIAKRYEAGTFDGMTDTYNYRADHGWCDAFGDAKYVQTHRDYSDALIARVLGRVYREWCDADVPAPTVEDYRAGRIYTVRARCGDFTREVHRAMHRHNLSDPQCGRVPPGEPPCAHLPPTPHNPDRPA